MSTTIKFPYHPTPFEHWDIKNHDLTRRKRVVFKARKKDKTVTIINPGSTPVKIAGSWLKRLGWWRNLAPGEHVSGPTEEINKVYARAGDEGKAEIAIARFW